MVLDGKMILRAVNGHVAQPDNRSPLTPEPVAVDVVGDSIAIKASTGDSLHSGYGMEYQLGVVSGIKPIVIDTGWHFTDLHTTSKHQKARDSACYVAPFTPVRPKVIRPATYLSTSRASDSISNLGPDTRGAASINRPKSSGEMKAPVACSTTAAGRETYEDDQPLDPRDAKPRWPLGLSREEFLEQYYEGDRARLQAKLDRGVFGFPPRFCPRRHKPPLELLDSRYPLPQTKYDLDFAQGTEEKHSAFWDSFPEHVGLRRKYISDLKDAAFNKLATKESVENSIIRVRMSMRKRPQTERGDVIPPQYGRLLDHLKSLDEEIAAIHDKWRKEVLDLSEFVEKTFRPEYHGKQVEENIMAAKQVKLAKKDNYHAAMRVAGWGPMPYVEHPQSDLPSTRDTATVPAWIEAFESEYPVWLEGDEPRERFNSLLNTIHCLEKTAGGKRFPGVITVEQPQELHKSWHDADPGWPHPKSQRSGGWWVCRTGPGASKAEESCEICRHKRDTRSVGHYGPKRPSAGETLNEVMGDMENAFARQMIDDKKIVVARVRSEMRNANRKVKLGSSPIFEKGWYGGYIN